MAFNRKPQVLLQKSVDLTCVEKPSQNSKALLQRLVFLYIFFVTGIQF
jgi:hypothetical protein